MRSWSHSSRQMEFCFSPQPVNLPASLFSGRSSSWLLFCLTLFCHFPITWFGIQAGSTNRLCLAPLFTHFHPIPRVIQAPLAPTSFKPAQGSWEQWACWKQVTRADGAGPAAPWPSAGCQARQLKGEQAAKPALNCYCSSGLGSSFDYKCISFSGLQPTLRNNQVSSKTGTHRYNVCQQHTVLESMWGQT